MTQFVGTLVKTFSGKYYYVHSYNEKEQVCKVSETNEYGVTKTEQHEVPALELVGAEIIDSP
jgi:hypothetical protein